MNLLVARLESFAKLSDSEKVTLQSAVSTARRQRRHALPTAGMDPAQSMVVVLSGLACRYKILDAGRRQILGYLVAGDLCGLRMSTLSRAGYCIDTFGPTQLGILSAARFLSCPDQYPNLTRAIELSLLAEESIAREWITNVGQRTAYERVAHLLCELFVRLKRVGLTQDDQFNLPLTQRDLGEALALSSVHVNRVLRQMCQDGVATFRHGRLELTDYCALQRIAGFDSTYLHL